MSAALWDSLFMSVMRAGDLPGGVQEVHSLPGGAAFIA